MTLKEYVIQKIKPDDYYAKRFPNWNPRVRGNIRCPFHSDDSPSLAIGLRNGGAHCHGARCGKSIGNIVHFESELKSVSEDITCRRLYSEFIRKIVSKKVIQEYRQALCENQNQVIKIKKEMGLNAESQLRFSIGWDEKSMRITIPIFDEFSQCVNVRFYKLPSERGPNDKAKIYNLDGYGGLDLFPFPKTANKSTPLFFMASEKEAMLAIQLGLAAFTTTSGEGSWNPDWNPLMQDRDVYLVFDKDEGGRAAADRIEKAFALDANVKTIWLPFNQQRPDRKDFADWILKEKHSIDELRPLLKSSTGQRELSSNTNRLTQVYDRTSAEPHGTRVPPSVHAFPELPDFYSEEQFDLSKISSRSELLNKRIKTQGIVAAKSPNTFSIPWKFKIKAKNTIETEYEMPIGRHLLMFIRSSDTSILSCIQKLMGLSNGTIIEPLAYLTATEVEIIPTAVVDQDVPYVVQRCYYFGDRIESNIPYYLEVIPTSEIRTQETIGIITKFIPLSKSIDKFELTPEVEADLSFFQTDDPWKKLKEIANEVSRNYSRIFNRVDWHMVALLTWASPIGFRFPNDNRLQRGWINSLALGDTQTGKSEVAIALRSLFQCGVFVNSENCTYVGLVGGAIKMGSGQLMLRWGRIPLSDKQLVVLEELSGLSVTEIANMSDVRSGGIARLDKGGINSETNARTRLLCLSNVRAERKNLSNYLFGVYAIRELIGHGEDIARFDLITTLTDREVSTEIINANQKNFALNAKDNCPAPDQFQKLIHFIWSLTPDQIYFTDEAYEACLAGTKKLSLEYHPSIPIFKGGSGRYKLGRIAAAIACFQFSWNGKQVEVKSSHVVAAERLLRLTYNKPSFGYSEYSKQMFSREEIKEPKVLRLAFRNTISTSRLSKVLKTLIHSTRFTREEFVAICGIPSIYGDRLISALVNEHAIRKGDGPVWEIEPAGKKFLDDLIKRETKIK